MDPIKSILVSTDFSDLSFNAFPAADLLASTFGAAVHLVYVGHVDVPPLLMDVPARPLREILDVHEEQAAQRLGTLVKERFADALEVSAHVRTGVPHEEIVTLAEELAVDLIVMATHGRGFLSHAMLGSTTEKVLRRAPCPVLAVRRGTVD